MRRLAALALIALAASDCIGSSGQQAHRTISVKPKVGRYTFQIDQGVSTGDTILCVQGKALTRHYQSARTVGFRAARTSRPGIEWGLAT